MERCECNRCRGGKYLKRRAIEDHLDAYGRFLGITYRAEQDERYRESHGPGVTVEASTADHLLSKSIFIFSDKDFAHLS